MSTKIEELKKQLSSQNEQERLAALSETLNHGQQGLELLIEQSLKDQSERVKQSAYRIFQGDNSYLNTPKSLTPCPTDIITSLAISSDNTILVGGSWQKIWVWNLQNGEVIRSIEGHSHWVLSVAISPDGNTLVSGSADKTIKIWDLKNGQLIHTLIDSSRDFNWVTTVAITPNGKSIVSGNTNKTIKIWDLNTGKLNKTLKDSKELSSVLSLCISRDGKMIVCGSTNNKITLWNLDSGQFIDSIEGHSAWIQALSITSDNNTLISGSRDGVVKFWQSKPEEESSNESGSVLGKGLVDVAAIVAIFLLGWQIALGGGFLGRILVDLLTDKNLTTLPLQNLECTKTLSYNRLINSLACHVNQNILVVSFSKYIKIFDLKDNKIIYTLPEQPDFISSVAITPNGQTLVIAGKNWVTLLKAKTGNPLHAIKGCSYPRLSKIVILKSSQEVILGQSKHFSVKGLDQNNREMNLDNKDVKWEATGGKIEQGLFTAYQQEGKFEVKAKIGIFETSVEITIIEPPRISEISVTPSRITLEFGKTQQFTAQVLDQRKNSMQETVLWEVREGGTIDRNGKFIAGENRGEFEIIASIGSIRRVILVTIIEPRKLIKLIITSLISSLEFGESFQFQVKGLDQYGDNIPTGKITWVASSGSITNQGMFYVSNREETVIIKASIGIIETSTEIKVCEPSRLTLIEILPSSVILEPGKSQKFNVVVFNQRHEEMFVDDIRWNATDGFIQQNGNFCSGEQQKGDCLVTVNVGHLRANADVTVIPVLKELKISPEQVEIQPEETVTFTVTGFDQVGAPLDISNVIWTTTKGGTITNKGVFKGNYKKPEVTVTAKVEKFSDTAKVILLPVLRRLEIQPGFVYLQSNEQQRFIVKGFDQFGSPIAAGKVYWKTTGGKIYQDGRLTFTRNEQGYFQVTATSQLVSKYTQNIRNLFLYTGITSRIISYLISHEMLFQDMFALDSGSTDTDKILDDSIVDETQEVDISIEEPGTIQETNTIVKADEQLGIEIDQITDVDIILNPDILDFYTALEEWLWKKLQELVAKVFLSISRFCLREASANLSASADVFVLAVEYNPYQYFKCLNVLEGHSGIVPSLVITPDGEKLISGSWDDTIKIWDLQAGYLLNTLKSHTHDVECVAITPDGQTLVSAGWDNTIKIWDLKTNELLHSLYCSNHVVLAAVTPDGQKFVSAEINNIIKLWDLNNQEVIKSWRNSSSDSSHPFFWHKCIVISPDQRRIIVGRKNIKSYDLITGKLRTIIGSDFGWIYALAITPDGKTLISSHDREIKIWDLTAKKYPRVRLTLRSFAEVVYALTFTKDGQRIVSAGRRKIINDDYESFIEIWDLNTGEKLHFIKEYFTGDRSVYCLAMTPDGKQIISGYRDGTIRIWGIPELSL